jgi:uncharacterized repeat protein (TIGR01451 family)
VRKYTLLVVVPLLAGAALAWRVRVADGQTPADTAPVRGAWTPHVIATARPVTDPNQPGAPAVPTVRPQPMEAPPAVRTGPASGDPAALPPVPGESVRLVSGPTQRPAPTAAPPGACLVVEKVGPSAVALGKPLIYEIIVRNVGGAEAQRVRVEEQVPAGAAVAGAEPRPEVHGGVLTWDLGSLATGAEARLHVTLQPPPDGDVTTTATVTCATISTLRAHVARSGLSLSVAEPPPARAGQPVTFKIQLVNNATAPLRGATLRARLAEGLRHAAGSQLEAVIPTLAPGEVKEVPLEVVAAKAGRHSLAVGVSASGTDLASGEATVEVSNATPSAPAPSSSPSAPLPQPAAPSQPAAPGAKPTEAPRAGPDLGPLPPIDPLPPQSQTTPPKGTEKPIASTGGATVTFDVKDADPALEVGRETTYEIRVLNQSAAPTRDVLVQAVLPEEMAFVHAEDPAGRAVEVSGQQVAFAALPSLSGRHEAIYHVRAKALKPGEGRFTARLQCAAMSRPLSQEVSTRVYTDEKSGGKAGGQ